MSMYFEQPIIIFDTTEALNSTTGSFLVYGGVSINSTYQSTNVTSGAFTVAGGVGISKNVNIGGITNIRDTTESVGSNSGALVVSGGVGIGSDLNVGGDATVNGNMYVAGTLTYINSETLNVADNTLVLNAGPAGSRDGGVLIARAAVDVIADGAVTSGVLSAIAQNSFTLGGVFTNNYNGWWLTTSQGNAQIATYNGTSGTFFTSANTLPVSPSDVDFSLYAKSYMGSYYDEIADEFKFSFVSDVQDPKVTLNNNGYYADVRLKNLYATTVSSTNIVVTGASSIANLALTGATLSAATIGNLWVNTSLYSNGIANLASGLNVSGGTIVQGITSSSLNTGNLSATGPSILAGVTASNLFVSGGSVFDSVTASSLSVSGPVSFNSISTGSLNVTGSSTLSGGITAGSLNVTGASILQGVTAGSVSASAINTGSLNATDASILAGVTASSLFVSGPVTFSTITTGGLAVTGASTIAGAVTVGSLFVSGGSILNDASMSSLTTGSLTVTNGSTLNTVTANLVTIGSLQVTGSSTFAGNMLVTGGNFTVTGGSVIFNTVDVSPSMADIIKERSATVANNISSPTDVLAFVFSNSIARAFDAVVSVDIQGTSSNKYAYYNLKGVQKDSGNWVLNSSFVGDITGITFSISSGQLQYTTRNKPDFTSGTVKFRALTTTV